MSSSSGVIIVDWVFFFNGKLLGDDQNFWDCIIVWWVEFIFQIKLLVIVILVVSLMMMGIMFFVLNGIQCDVVMNDMCYVWDLGLLLVGNVIELVVQGQDCELVNVVEKFWCFSCSVCYIFFVDFEGVVYLGIFISVIFSSGDGEFCLN